LAILGGEHAIGRLEFGDELPLVIVDVLAERTSPRENDRPTSPPDRGRYGTNPCMNDQDVRPGDLAFEFGPSQKRDWS
jgi:hypothetical protein